MNYHLEGIFHAEKAKVWDCWRVYTDLTQEEIESVHGAAVLSMGDRKFGFPVRIDPRFSEDKVLGKLMELAQQKHNREICTCRPHYHSNGQIDPVHFEDCPCYSEMDKCCHPPEIRGVFCGYDIDRDEIKVITYRGKLYYAEGEAEPDCVMVKESALRKIRHKIECANFAFHKFYGETSILTSKTMLNFLDGWSMTKDTEDMVREILPE